MVNPVQPRPADQYENVTLDTGRSPQVEQYEQQIAPTTDYTGDYNNQLDKEEDASGNGTKKAADYESEAHDSTLEKAIDVELDERAQAQKLMRTATWVNTFFLLTTDILGPSQAPYSFATLGYVPGCLLYFFFGVAAGYAGFVLQRLFLAYDSEVRPCRTYGDIGERVFEFWGYKLGLAVRYWTSFFQALQLFLNVAVIVLASAQAMYQMAFNGTCFVGLAAAFTACGFILGFIKTLRSLSHLANSCIWINIFICVATLAVASYTAPLTNINAAAPSSIFQAGFIPTDANGNGLVAAHGVAFQNLPLEAAVNGITTMVYAYGGATIFVEFMAEMKNPRDFWKAWALSLGLIMSCYFSYGVALYALQGPYVGNPGNQGISPYGWQTALNALNLFTGLIAAVMYGNVGMKVIYITVFQEMFKAPPLTTRRGAIFWYIFAIGFWWLAFVLAEVVPQLGAFSGIVSSLCIMQFSYVLPPLFQLFYEVQQDQTWRDVFFRRAWLKAFDLVFCLGAIALMGIGMWASVEVLISAINTGTVAIFGCNGP